MGNCESNSGGTPSLVLYPAIQVVPKGLYDVIGCDTDMRGAALEHGQNRNQNTAYGADLSSIRVCRRWYGEKMSEQFIGPVNQIAPARGSCFRSPRHHLPQDWPLSFTCQVCGLST